MPERAESPLTVRITKMKNDPVVTIIGAGLAGSEAANICARAGVHVKLYEMKPVKFSPAHHSENFAELVCSNSLRAAARENAIGLLKEELRHLGSLIMEAADKSAIPAGGALAVDRDEFSGYITESETILLSKSFPVKSPRYLKKVSSLLRPVLLLKASSMRISLRLPVILPVFISLTARLPSSPVIQ